MLFKSFTIKNFKGIKELTIDLDKSPNSNIYPLVGLNESGKTTILEAISNFDPNPEIGPSDNQTTTLQKNPNAFLPLNERANFNGYISIGATLRFEEEDIKYINSALKKETPYSEIKRVSQTEYSRQYNFQDSNHSGTQRFWTGLSARKPTDPVGKFTNLWSKDRQVWNLLDSFVSTRIPSIVYFPNFLFDFPSRIYLISTSSQAEEQKKEQFYIELIQDILSSLGIDAKIEKHLISRMQGATENDRKNLRRILQLMEQKVTEIVFGAWNEIFKSRVKNSKVRIEAGKDENHNPYVEFYIESPDGIYNLNDRSLGFRWFFTFLIFTQFRHYRHDSPKGMMFLFDEPASNLHSSAQKQLLKSFEKLGKDVKVIYTTHSHYMIDPKRLESTYIVQNKGLDLESPENTSPKRTDIKIESYRNFVSKHPTEIDSFQPVLDVLEYAPSDLEKIPNCTFLEGKNDFYVLKYFNDIILNSEKKINLMPGLGSGDLDVLISLYLGWGKQFVVLLDADKAGKREKQRYIEKFGDLLTSKIFTIEDADSSWSEKGMEKLFNPDDALSFQRTCFPDSKEFNKNQFNRSIQEGLINGKKFEWSKDTLERFSLLLEFLRSKFS